MELNTTNMYDSKIWFISDTHYGHKNICRGTTNWEDRNSARDFDTIEEMNDAIIEGINSLVKPADTLYHLGDIAMGGVDNLFEFLDRVNCNNIHLILGNHDGHVRKDTNGCRLIFSSINDLSELKIDGKRVVLCHYAMRVWNKSHHGSYHLYGHSHGTIPDFHGKSMDVGIDATFNRIGEYRPLNWEEINSTLKDIPVKFIDHHNKNTN